MLLEELLKSHGDDAPSGENLEYDPVFTEMELAAQPGEERQAGDEIIAAEEPNHKVVVEKAMAVLERSHDLRAAVLLAQSQLRLTGLAGFADATSYIRGCLEQYWDSCHPQLDAEDDDDPTMRVNAVLALADAQTTLRALRMAPLTQSNTFGRITLRDIAVADGEASPSADMDGVPDLTAISAAFKDTKPEILQETLAAARTAMADVQAINRMFDEKTPGQGPDLDPLSKLLKRAVAKLADAIGVPEEAAEETGEAGSEAAAAAPAVSGGGAINTQRDVQLALERIIGFYERTEPSSPLPILLRRALRLVGADFLTIMRDMAPSGIDNVNLIGGIEEE